jgi:hypothetical protein
MYRWLANAINHTRNNDMRMITSMTTQGVDGGQLDSYGFLTHDALALASLDTINDTTYAKNYRRDWLLTAPTYRFMHCDKVCASSSPLRCVTKSLPSEWVDPAIRKRNLPGRGDCCHTKGHAE